MKLEDNQSADQGEIDARRKDAEDAPRSLLAAEGQRGRLRRAILGAVAGRREGRRRRPGPTLQVD